jgi:CheY-like chemotaxis protein/DNA-binding XRE family transcriptional regulator
MRWGLMRSKTASIFATNMKAARKRRNFTVADLARALEITPHAIYKWEQEGVIPKDHMLDRINEVLGLLPGQLFAENLTMPDKPIIAKFTIKEALEAVNNYPGKLVLKIAEKADSMGFSTKTRILIIEDDDIILDILQREFEKEGYEVFKAQNGKEALDFLQHHEVEVVISDNHMPNVTGRMVMQFLLEHRPEVLRVLASGTIHESEMEKLKPHAFLRKPYEKKDLLNAVKKLLSERRTYGKNA